MRPIRAPLAAAGLALAAVCLGPAAATAQPAAAAPPSAPYPLKDHSLDTLAREFGGFWRSTDGLSVEKFETMQQPLTPPYQAMKEEQTRNRKEGRQIFSADQLCIPRGMPRMMISLGTAFELVAHPKDLSLIIGDETGLQIRNLWTDGRKPTPDERLFDNFAGESIGNWEGDSLVVDTDGLRPTNEFLYGVKGHKLKVNERIYKTGPDTLEVLTTVMDPVVFTKPWIYTAHFRRDMNGNFTEQKYCIRALDREVDKNGKEGFDLTPPPER